MLDCDRCHRWFHGPCVGVVEGMLPENWVCDECQIRRQVCFGVTCAVVHSSPFTPHPSSARAPARRTRASCHFFSGCGYVTDHGLLVSRSFTRLPLATTHGRSSLIRMPRGLHRHRRDDPRAARQARYLRRKAQAVVVTT